jgi:histone deacetylase 11
LRYRHIITGFCLAWAFFSCVKNAGHLRGSIMRPTQLPVIFSAHYDISLHGLEQLHPFDTAKYGKIFRYLTEKLGIDPGRFVHPTCVSERQLLTVHTKEYLASLHDARVIAEIAELGVLSAIPAAVLQENVLKPMKYAAGGTVLGVDLALQYGWAVNLSGGYHHAKADSGSGFCFFADIPLAVALAREARAGLRVLIVDLDAHQGNGCESFFKDSSGIFIFDVYNRDIFPADAEAAQYIDFAYPVRSGTADAEYLELLRTELPEAIKIAQPDLIIYNAGTDIYENDPLGAMRITEEGIRKRDEIVCACAFEHKIPILMLLSGGYAPQSAGIISRSLENLFQHVLKVAL